MVLWEDGALSDVLHAEAMVTGLPERCWRAWWDELSPIERTWWHTHAQRPFLTAEQAHLLRAEGLPQVTIPGQPPVTEQVLFPLDLADLLEQDRADH